MEGQKQNSYYEELKKRMESLKKEEMAALVAFDEEKVKKIRIEIWKLDEEITKNESKIAKEKKNPKKTPFIASKNTLSPEVGSKPTEIKMEVPKKPEPKPEEIKEVPKPVQTTYTTPEPIPEPKKEIPIMSQEEMDYLVPKPPQTFDEQMKALRERLTVAEKEDDEKKVLKIEDEIRTLEKRIKGIKDSDERQEEVKLIQNNDEKKREDLRNEISSNMDIYETRQKYLQIKNDKTKGKEYSFDKKQYTEALNIAEKNYQDTKNKIVKEFLDKGEPEKAREFLLTQTDLNRTDNIENSSMPEKMKRAIANGTMWYDSIGNDPKDSKLVQLGKKIGKTIMSIALIGGASAATLAGIAVAMPGIVSTTAIAGIVGTGIAKRMAIPVLATTISSVIPLLPKQVQPIAGKLMSGSMSALSLMSMAGVIGLTAGKLVGKATSRWFSEKAITQKTGEITNKINQLTTELGSKEFDPSQLENKVKEIEENYKKIAEMTESKRMWRGIIGVSSSLATGTAFLAYAGHTMDENAKLQEELKNKEVEQKPIVVDEPKIENHINPDAIVHQGQGITQAFAEQIKANPELAKELGFTGDIDNPKDMAYFTRDLAIKMGYMDSEGHEVRVAEADKVAYELKIENGQIIVDEKTVDGQMLETHHQGDKFEAKPDEKYEYNDEKDHRPEYQPKHVSEDIQHTPQENTQPAQEERTEYDDTSKPPETRHIEPKQEESIKTEEGKMEQSKTVPEKTTEIPVTGSPSNPFNLPLETLAEVKEIHESNINHLTSASSLSALDRENLQDTIKEGAASVMLKEDVNDLYKPLHNYLDELHKITGLEPREGNAIQPEEKIEEYIHRAEMKAAELHKLDDVKLDNTNISNHTENNNTVSDAKHEKTVDVQKHDNTTTTTTNEHISGTVRMTPEIIEKTNHLAELIQKKDISAEELHDELEKIKGGPLSKGDELSIKGIMNNPDSPSLREKLTMSVRVMMIEKQADQNTTPTPVEQPKNSTEEQNTNNKLSEQEVKEKELLNKKEELETRVKEEQEKQDQIKKEMEKVQKDSNLLKNDIKDMEKQLGDKEKLEDTSKSLEESSKKIHENSKSIKDTNEKIENVSKNLEDEKTKFEKLQAEVQKHRDIIDKEMHENEQIGKEIDRVEAEKGISLTRAEKSNIAMKMFPESADRFKL